MPGGLHPSDAGRARLRQRRDALHRPRGVHRLRRVRRGLPRGRLLRRGPAPGGVAEVHADQRGLLHEPLAGLITKLDFVSIPSRDAERARDFYGETLGLRPDPHAKYEFWAGDTCLVIWEPERLGMQFSPQKNGHLALHVDDVEASRAELEAK